VQEAVFLLDDAVRFELCDERFGDALAWR
jgi:hypothetical protein